MLPSEFLLILFVARFVSPASNASVGLDGCSSLGFNFLAFVVVKKFDPCNDRLGRHVYSPGFEPGGAKGFSENIRNLVFGGDELNLKDSLGGN
ncbi:hypothetical protein AKJ16_DCAP08576 [Drosera capensis]